MCQLSTTSCHAALDDSESLESPKRALRHATHLTTGCPRPSGQNFNSLINLWQRSPNRLSSRARGIGSVCSRNSRTQRQTELRLDSYDAGGRTSIGVASSTDLTGQDDRLGSASGHPCPSLPWTERPETLSTALARSPWRPNASRKNAEYGALLGVAKRLASRATRCDSLPQRMKKSPHYPWIERSHG